MPRFNILTFNILTHSCISDVWQSEETLPMIKFRHFLLYTVLKTTTVPAWTYVYLLHRAI